jgi:hypothetical protein
MQPHSVKLPVSPYLRLECKFWLGDDGWNATIESLGLTVHAPDFQSAKKYIELALGKHIEEVLAQSGKATRAHAA